MGNKGFGFTAPKVKFQYAGKLQPGKVLPALEVPSHIKRPDYAKTGKPKSSSKTMKMPWDVSPLHPDDIPRMRVAGRIAREVFTFLHSVAFSIQFIECSVFSVIMFNFPTGSIRCSTKQFVAFV